ncbi:MAG: hypothetical protein A4S09_07830 [Proteobacteria bacterium SG_bin7]|nr:MAG: hypothetical protein A4S09_07830 [Proteobacteria bacterium SG_bin7]
MDWVKKFLSESDLKEIEAAVIKAEKSTSGEIVPVLIRQSGAYYHIPIIVFLILLTAIQFLNFRPANGWYFFCEIIVLATVSQVLTKISLVRRVLTYTQEAARQVNIRAELEFYSSRINQTEDQTGILLFLSFQERMAVVLADKKISKVHDNKTWDEVVALMTSSIKEGKLKDGIVKAIERCGEILAKDFPKREFDTDELSNKLIIKDI